MSDSSEITKKKSLIMQPHITLSCKSPYFGTYITVPLTREGIEFLKEKVLPVMEIVLNQLRAWECSI